MSIRTKVSAILDMPIREGQYSAYARVLDAQGAFSKKILQDIVLAVCEELESLEHALEVINLKLDSQKSEPASPENTPKTAPIDETSLLHHCDNCEKTFSTKLALIGHQKSHVQTA